MAEVGWGADMTFVIGTGGIDLSVARCWVFRRSWWGVFWKNVGLALPVAWSSRWAPGDWPILRDEPRS